ncbi:MAG: PAS domain S-box protein, partial [Ignavibacteria bacterium]|nr:PAS domain S-box protein [Ignavibacteria bacterium]
IFLIQFIRKDMIIVELLYNLAVLIALSVLSGFINLRFDRKNLISKVLQGLLFGVTAIVGMLNPFVLTEGIIFDGRSIVISLSTLFFGPVSGAIAAIMAVAFRLHIGGGGTLMGTLVILSSFFIGFYFYLRKQKFSAKRISNRQLYLFGLVVHIAMLILVLALPPKNILDTYHAISFTVIIIYPLVTIVIGKILLDQEENQGFLVKLKESEQKYRLLVENQNDMIIKVDKDGKFTFVSPSYCKLFGKREDELIGKSFIPLVHDDDIENTRDAMLDLYHEPYSCYVEQRALTEEGWKWLAWSDTAVLDADGNVESIIGVGRDITSRKNAEEELKYSEEKFFKAFQASPDSLTLTELDTGKLLEANDGFERVFGYSKEEVIGTSTLNMGVWVNPEDRIAVVSKLKDEGSVKDYEAIGRKKNGESLVGLISAEIIRVAGQSLLLIMVRDITESKKAEEILIKNEEKYRMLLELASDAFFQGDTKGNLITINDKAIELTGYSKNELLKMNIKELFVDESLNKNPLRYNLLQAGETIKSERSLLRKDGISLIIEMNSRQMPDGTYQSFFRDITERKKLINDLISAKEKAEEMNRVKTYFFANMSHELRTPFVGIQGYSELLSESLKNPEEKEMAEQILNSSKRLTDTLNKILNVTRLEFDKLDLKLVDVDVVELIERLSTLYSKSAAINKTQIKTHILTKPVRIKTDAKLLEETVTNLLNNAVKYTANGIIEITCHLQLRNKKNYLKIVIADSGVGIPKDKQEIIWQEFRQASEGLNRSFEGTGLGLTIIKKYITALDGTINLKSEVGEGTIFTIELPVVLSESQNIVSEKKIEQSIIRNEIAAASKYKILYVEDDMIALKYIDTVLKSSYNIATAFTADLALELINKNKYDILMLDINLGKGIDGVELMQVIRRIPGYEATPIVAVTAYAASSDKAEFLSKGFSYYISKPFSSAQLKNLLNSILG